MLLQSTFIIKAATFMLNTVPFSEGGRDRIRANSSESSQTLFLFPPLPIMDSNFFLICLFKLGRLLSPSLSDFLSVGRPR